MSARAECGAIDSTAKPHFRNCFLSYLYSSDRRPPWMQTQNSGLFAAPVWVPRQEPVRVWTQSGGAFNNIF